MCGIAGLLSLKRNERETFSMVQLMTKALAHRGPDDEQYFAADGICLGHRRLSIIDIEHGQQPMRSGDGRYVLVFNGEIYNYIELRQQLVQKGTRLKTFSDTEVLLEILIQEREKGIGKLNGMFAFAFFDLTEKTFLLCRDRVGIKPLYFSVINDELVFASEIKAILKSGLIRPAVNHKALQEYLTYQFCMGSKTMFDGVMRIEPGHYISGRESSIDKVVKYWDTNFSVDSYHNEDFFEDELLGLLHDSVKLQMRSDVPVGVYLSGGIDSSAIAALAHEVSGNSIQAFHGKFLEGPAYDESQYAKIVASRTSALYHEVTPSLNDFVDGFGALIYALDEPVAGPGSFPQMHVSRNASAHVKVILGGQGGDELFCGYARYLVGYLEQAMKGSIFETQEEGKYLVNLNTIIKSLPLLKQYTPLMRTFWQKGLFDEMDARYFRLVDRSPDLDQILTEETLRSLSKEEVFESFRMIFNHPDTKSYINKMTHFDLKTLLPALLQVEDRMSMISSIESRVPLLDHRIIDLVTTMPPAIKFNEGQTKYIFKKTLRNKVPAEILDRKDKMGFPVPLNEWMSDKTFQSYVRDLLGSKKARERGIFKTGVEDMLLHKNNNYGRQLWGVLSLEMWFQTFFE
jgi:asparagine synthase (glutamine-hydrolysing)